MKYLLTISTILITLSANMFGQSKLRVFGHLTQGFAISDEHQIFGIPTNGSSDYRNLALQFRYDVNTKNNLIVQIAHKRLGKHPTQSDASDLELDWGFFEHHFSPEIFFKFGKVQMPLGIYNELRDVSVLLPFYRAPSSVYSESRASGEYVNGVVFGYSAKLGKGWGFRSDVFAGQWSWTEWFIIASFLNDDVSIIMEEVDIEKAFGLQGWLNSPIDGLRFGLSGFYGQTKSGMSELLSGIANPALFNYMLSLDADFEKYSFRTEKNALTIVNSPFVMDSYYIQLGYNVWEKISLNAMYESVRFNNFKVTYDTGILPLGTVLSRDIHQEIGVGVNYAFSTNIVMKFEIHSTEGYFIEDAPITPYSPKGAMSRYAILSLATSF